MKASLPNLTRLLSRQCLAVCGIVVLLAAVGIWFYSTTSSLADYVPLALVFLSAIVAIAGKSWDDSRQGLSRVTLTGRVLVALAVFGLIGGVRNTQSNQSKLERTRELAYSQLMKGISMVLFPITSSWREPPTNNIDILAKARETATVDVLASTRIVPFADTMAMIEDTRLFLITANGARVRSSCGLPHRGFRALYELFDFCVDGGEAKMRDTAQAFVGDLDSQTVDLLNAILENEFYKSQYSNLAQHEAFYYQGLRDEVGADSKTADRTWLALLAVARDMLPRKNDDDASSAQDEWSPWLYLGTYYFGRNTDAGDYKIFIDTVAAFVEHVDATTSQRHRIDTY
ncbi:MAG: hypothetical protein OXH99_01710 [Bryobacterales bacterium]|nr:hypothetical protein [Bryobacterales bacterium]